MNSLRLGTPEIVRTGMVSVHMPEIAKHIADSLLQRREDADIARDMTELRIKFDGFQYFLPAMNIQ